MIKQVNLFVQEAPEPEFSARRVLMGLGVIVLAFLLYGALGLMQSGNMSATIARNDAQIAAQKQALQQFVQKLGERPKPEAVAAEIAALKVLADESQQVIAMLNSPAAAGYGGHLVALGQVTENDVWLTGLKIGSDGKSVALTGHSLRNEAVLRYAQRIGERLSGSGVQFKAVELTPDPVLKTESDVTITSVTFRLY